MTTCAHKQAQCFGCAYHKIEELPPVDAPASAESRVIAIAGNPNAGKTSVFNQLTGSTQHVANFPGVTVERKEGHTLRHGLNWRVVDLPGTYSLTAYSIEEIVARGFLVEERPDLVLDVLDASNMQRNLYLTTQLLELDLPIVLAANMMDVARRRKVKIDFEELATRLGIPVVLLEGHRGIGLSRLVEVATHELTHPQSNRGLISFGEATEKKIALLEARLQDGLLDLPHPPIRWIALRLLEGDHHVHERLSLWHTEAESILKLADDLHEEIRKEQDMEAEVFMANRRHEFIRELLVACRLKTASPGHLFRSDFTDRILLHRYLGMPIFLFIMYLIFWLTFTLGETPMGWIETGLALLTTWIDGNWVTPDGHWLKSLLLDGVLGGVGGVLIFLPNILLLFFCLTLMEDTGYMSRAAFLMDRLMHKIGLHGKSFIPLLTGFGCTIPGIMGTRVLENERDRLLTMMVLPLMSCGARLPIYLLLIPAFFPESMHAEMLFLIYAIGMVLAIGMAKILRISVLKGENTPFVMELPPYKFPTMKSLYMQVQLRAWLYLRKAGTIILAVSIFLWILGSWPTSSADSDMNTRILHAQNSGQTELVSELQNQQAEASLEASMLGHIGKAIEPVMAPMGFDWKISTSMLGAFAAKELFVAQIAVVMSMGDADEGSTGLREILRKNYTPLVGFSVMLFALVAFPCMATFAVTRRETGSTKWAVFQLASLTGMAWVLCTAVYQIGTLLGY
jgi:ferrous iron transport protein B